MSYRNKTYVIFDGDNDMWAYGYMKGWKSNENMDFNFYDAHDVRPLTDRASDETIKQRLRERMASSKQVIVLVGDNTKNLYKFVRWEIEIALAKGLPIIVVNLNNERRMDAGLCPPILKNSLAIHVAYKMKIIQYALDNWPDQHERIQASSTGDYYYSDAIYAKLGV